MSNAQYTNVNDVKRVKQTHDVDELANCVNALLFQLCNSKFLSALDVCTPFRAI